VTGELDRAPVTPAPFVWHRLARLCTSSSHLIRQAKIRARTCLPSRVKWNLDQWPPWSLRALNVSHASWRLVGLSDHLLGFITNQLDLETSWRSSRSIWDSPTAPDCIETGPIPSYPSPLSGQVLLPVAPFRPRDRSPAPSCCSFNPGKAAVRQRRTRPPSGDELLHRILAVLGSLNDSLRCGRRPALNPRPRATTIQAAFRGWRRQCKLGSASLQTTLRSQ
jgi:hypothetical protein